VLTATAIITATDTILPASRTFTYVASHLVREVPIPPQLVQALDHHFDLAAAQRDPERAHRRVWPMHRATA
jgi:hypothetical protein